MGEIKKFAKYVVMIIVFYLFTMLMTYVGFNSTYQNIEQNTVTPEQIKIDVAQATKVNGRIFGEVTSTQENNLEGKYIKIQIYDRRDELVGVKYLKIENTNVDEPKKFVTYFTADNVKSYDIYVVEDSENLQDEIKSVAELFKGVFKEKELAKSLVWSFVLWGIFF